MRLRFTALRCLSLRNLISSKRAEEPFLSYRSEFDGLPEPLCALYGENSLDLSSSEFRRNLVVRGADLSAWVGKNFRFQGIEFEGSEDCKPCYWMDEAVAPGTDELLKKQFQGGLRARILTDGWLRIPTAP